MWLFLYAIVFSMKIKAGVAELVDASDSKSDELACVGSSPTFGTKKATLIKGCFFII